MKLGINASRARSGGAKAHLIGILKDGNPLAHGFTQVHVWSYRELLDALPEFPWLVKHCPQATERSIMQQLWWERFSLPRELADNNCSILFNVDAGTICQFHPNVTMSQDMLSYEPREINRYGWSKARLRLLILWWVQNASLRRADGAIFLTQYAAQVIQGFCGPCRAIALIPHGIGDAFRGIVHQQNWPDHGERAIECLYVSNAAPYKHQWHVVGAVELLRKQGYAIQLTLVGGGGGPAQKRLMRQIQTSDPKHEFVRQLPFVPQQELPNYLSRSDLFVFASSCENMPNTLLEAMAAGLPIVCSDRGPMPEVLADAGTYFDPEDPRSIATAIARMIKDDYLRTRCATLAKEYSAHYSWRRCADETFSFIKKVASHEFS